MVFRRGVTSDALMNSTSDVIGFVTAQTSTADDREKDFHYRSDQGLYTQRRAVINYFLVNYVIKLV